MYIRVSKKAVFKNKVDRLYNKLSIEEKIFTGGSGEEKEWISRDEEKYIIARILAFNNNIEVVGLLDIFTSTIEDELIVSFMVDPNYRNKGIATNLVLKAQNWFDATPTIADYLTLSAKVYNPASNNVAIKTGFIFDKKNSDEEWNSYKYYKN